MAWFTCEIWIASYECLYKKKVKKTNFALF